MAAQDFDLHRLVSNHDAQIQGISTRMDHVEKKLDVHDHKLDQIIAAVTKHDARPGFDWKAALGVMTNCAVLFGLICAGILYLASSNTAAQVAQTDNRITILDERQKALLARFEKMETALTPPWQARISWVEPDKGATR